MKKIVLIVLLSLTGLQSNAAPQIIDPITFDGSDQHKQQVIKYIQATVKQTYTSIGMGDPSTLRMMEKSELQAFKELTSATDQKLLRRVIRMYCRINMCSYTTINLMYKQQAAKSKETLQWDLTKTR